MHKFRLFARNPQIVQFTVYYVFKRLFFPTHVLVASVFATTFFFSISLFIHWGNTLPFVECLLRSRVTDTGVSLGLQAPLVCTLWKVYLEDLNYFDVKYRGWVFVSMKECLLEEIHLFFTHGWMDVFIHKLFFCQLWSRNLQKHVFISVKKLKTGGYLFFWQLKMWKPYIFQLCLCLGLDFNYAFCPLSLRVQRGFTPCDCFIMCHRLFHISVI